MSSSSSDTILGIVVIARHGDRLGFYQDPTTYTASDTSITPLGEQQEFALGSLLRSTYIDASSPSAIPGISPVVQSSQLQVRADAGDEGGVIFDSSVALLQGLFPPTSAENTTLANGTNVQSPLGGYQYIPIESVELNEDVSLEGHADCNTWNTYVTQVYNSSVFTEKATEAAPFLTALEPFVGDRTVTLENMFNIFDFVNVESIHNATFSKALPPTFHAQAQDLANFHEWIVFSDPTPSGIGNIDGFTILPSLLTALTRVANASDPLKLHYTAISYKPFISLFNLTAVTPTDNSQNLDGIVNYAASVVFEVVNQTSGIGVRMAFKNGTDDNTYKSLTGGLLGSSGIAPLNTFVQTLQPFGINDTLDWCNACGNQVDRGCAAFFSNNSTSKQLTVSHDKVSPVAAGFIGAGVTLAVVLALLAGLGLLGLIGLGASKSSVRGKKEGSLHS